MRSVLTALAVLLIAAPAAQAETAIMFDHRWRTGDPLLVAAARQDPGGPAVRVVEWRSCAPDGSPCSPLPDSAYGNQQRCAVPQASCRLEALPGDAAAGTVFEAVFEEGGATTTRRTPAWAGKVSASAPVAIAEAVVGRAVRFTPATWTGGFEAAPEVPAGPRSEHSLAACRHADGTECFAIRSASRELPPRWAGWYLFVHESRSYTGRWSALFPIAVPMIAISYQFDLANVDTTASRSQPVQVCCVLPAPPPAATPERPASPSAAVRARAQRRKGALHVASVRCAVRCAVRLTVTGGGTVVRSLAVKGARSLAIPPRRGVLRVRVVVDGKLLASGRSRTR